MTTIYGLFDEFDEIRYVGKTKHALPGRLNAHIKNSHKQKTHKAYWIMSMLPFKPTIKEIAKVEGDGSEAEQFYIACYRMIGAKLTNGTDGGEGCSHWTGKKLSDDMKKKISDGLKGHTPWNKGITYELHRCARKPLSDEHKKKLSGKAPWNKGKTLNESIRKKMSISHLKHNKPSN